jgi:hypothetical protein
MIADSLKILERLFVIDMFVKILEKVQMFGKVQKKFR